MEERTKKPLMLGVVIICLAVAAGITMKWTKARDRTRSIPASESVLMICRNPDCKAVYSMSLRDYAREMEADPERNPSQLSKLVCTKCSQKTAQKAIKCPKCEEVFVYGTAGMNEYPDKCPKCGFSAREDARPGN